MTIQYIQNYIKIRISTTHKYLCQIFSEIKKDDTKHLISKLL